MGKPVRFTLHAMDVLAERQLDPAWVERTLHKPDWQRPDANDPAVSLRFGSVPEREGRILRVAYVETATEFRVISAFLDRGARRPE